MKEGTRDKGGSLNPKSETRNPNSNGKGKDGEGQGKEEDRNERTGERGSGRVGEPANEVVGDSRNSKLETRNFNPIQNSGDVFIRDAGRFEGSTSAFRRMMAEFWLSYLFWHTARAPRLARWTKWVYLEFPVRLSKTIRSATFANARRIFGADLSDAKCRAFCRGVMSNFVNFVTDVGLGDRLDLEALAGRVSRINGREKYDAIRAKKHGAIIVTMHMGSFESATAALRQTEPKIHVLFKRDDRSQFEKLRMRMRHKLGVIEVPLDEGLGAWARLRDALHANEVVMLQGDRLLPGQKGERFDFMNGHIAVPTGPVRLALASGAPIIPIITTRGSDGLVTINIEDAIEVDQSEQMHEALDQLVRVIEKYVRAHPTQWLMLEPAFCEDMAEARK